PVLRDSHIDEDQGVAGGGPAQGKQKGHRIDTALGVNLRVSLAVFLFQMLNVIDQLGVRGPADQVGLLLQLVQENTRVSVDTNVSPDDSAEVVRIGIDVDHVRMLGDGVKCSRNLAVANADGQDDLDLLKCSF